MACVDCNDNINVITSTGCDDIPVTCENLINSECIVYSGSTLSNLSIVTNQGINDIFTAVDNALSETIKEITITIPSANVLTLSSGYTLMTSPGSGKYIEIIKISCYIGGNLGTPYTPIGVPLTIRTASASNSAYLTSDTILASTSSSRISQFVFNTVDVGYDGIRINDPLKIYSPGGDPTSGTGDLVINIIYKIQTQ